MAGQTVMLCVDGSDVAEEAFNYAMEHICKKEDNIIVINVPEYNMSLPALTSSWEQVCSDVKEKDKEIDKCNAKFVGTLRDRGNTGRALKPKGGKAGEVICETARKEGVNHIVMGTRGLGKFQRAFIGSVSQYVLNHAEIPVTIIPAKKS